MVNAAYNNFVCFECKVTAKSKDIGYGQAVFVVVFVVVWNWRGWGGGGGGYEWCGLERTHQTKQARTNNSGHILNIRSHQTQAFPLLKKDGHLTSDPKAQEELLNEQF